jgi:cytochrome P450
MSITDGFDLVSSHSYANKGVPHDLWTRLRAESPVHWCTPAGFEPFWAITKHADICEISKQPDTFSSANGIAMIQQDQDAQLRAQNQGFGAMRVIIEMDPPEHRDFRNVSSPVFTPRAVKAMDETIRTSAREIVDRLAGGAMFPYVKQSVRCRQNLDVFASDDAQISVRICSPVVE